MPNSNVNLLNQMTNEITKIGIVNKKLVLDKFSRYDSQDGGLREQIASSPLMSPLTKRNWKKILSYKFLEKTLAELNFSANVLEELLNYPHLEEVTVEEWRTLSKHEPQLVDLIMDENLKVPFDWLLPLAVQSAKMEGEFIANYKTIDAFMKLNGLPESNDRQLKDHYITREVLSLVTEYQVSYRLFSHLSSIYKYDRSGQDFVHTSALLKAHGNAIHSGNDLYRFNDGVQKIAKHLSDEKMLQLQEKLGTEFVTVVMDIGENVKIELNEKAVNHLFHKEGDAIEVLFHPYGDLVKEIMKSADKRPVSYSFGHRLSDSTKERILAFSQYLAINKKKGFFRLLEESNFDIGQVVSDSMLVDPRFYNLVNVNTLNEKALTRIASSTISNKQINKLSEPITFQEFEFLNEAGNFHVDMHALIGDMKVDERLRLLSMLPRITYKSTYLLPYEEFLQLVLASLKEKGFQSYSEWMKQKEVSLKGALFLHLFNEEWSSVLEDVKSDQDVEILLSYHLVEGETLLQMKKRLYDQLPLIVDFKEFLGASNSFIQTNLASFYHFYEKELMYAVMQYKEHLDEKQQVNLKLLCKAEIAGKLKDVKFRDEDFEKEIGIHTPQKVRETWKDDFSSIGKRFTFEESSDFYDLLNVGVIPTGTCQSWKDGSFRQCLLSIFDLNKKVVLVKQGEKVVGRAIIRLTKMKEKTNAKSSLEFIDIENESSLDSSIVHDGPNEKIVMFLERFYTTHTGTARKQMELGVIALTEQKAKDMNVELLYARTYAEEKSNAENVTLPIYISRSKNGNQYLDSLGGEANEESGGKYHNASVLRLT